MINIDTAIQCNKTNTIRKIIIQNNHNVEQNNHNVEQNKSLILMYM